ncbi:MAG: hypothetical protein PHG44_08470 [Lentisphaeria bacterium]|nr:hypothetical protein [Lentisphaeria bacterium]
MRFCFTLLLFACVSWAFEFDDYDSGRHLGWEQLYPAGRIMPYSGYSPPDQSNLRKDGFTLAGPAYGKAIEKLREDSLQSGMPIFATLQAKQGEQVISLQLLSDKDFKPDWDAICQSLREQVQSYSTKYPGIAYWNLTPEELRYWRKNEYRYLQLAYESIKASDPLKRPVYMYIPGHYGFEALQKYVPYLDIMGKGMYVNYAGRIHERIWVRQSSENLNNSIRGLEKEKFTLCVPEMFQNQADGRVDRIESRVRHDVFLALACGCKGVQIFSLAKRRNFDAANYDAYYAAYSRLAKELGGKEGLGQVFLFGQRRADLKGKITVGPEQLSFKPGAQKDEISLPAAYLAEFQYRKARYVVLVNSAEEKLEYEISGIPEGTQLSCAISKEKIAYEGAGRLKLELASLESRIFKLEKKSP